MLGLGLARVREGQLSDPQRRVGRGIAIRQSLEEREIALQNGPLRLFELDDRADIGAPMALLVLGGSEEVFDISVVYSYTHHWRQMTNSGF